MRGPFTPSPSRAVASAPEDKQSVTSTYLDSAEVYDPATGQPVLAGTMSEPRASHSATRSRVGRVLVVGGDSVGVHDPMTGTWTPTGGLIQDHAYHAATQPVGGGVLVVGGYTYGNGLPRPGSSTLSRESSPSPAGWASDKRRTP